MTIIRVGNNCCDAGRHVCTCTCEHASLRSVILRPLFQIFRNSLKSASLSRKFCVEMNFLCRKSPNLAYLIAVYLSLSFPANRIGLLQM
jgi:hypothetical protein